MLISFIQRVLLKISFLRKKDAILIGTPSHDNIGDSQIVLAEKRFLKDNKISFLEITTSEYKKHKDIIINNKNKFNFVVLHGGGNIGDEYIYEEDIRRDIIKEFFDKKIIIMPQTIYFSNTKKGINELEKTKEVYNNHSNLSIIARERQSYEFGKKHFKNVYLTPDIVLYLRKNKNSKKKNGILFLLRNDVEKNIDDSSINKLLIDLEKNNIKYKVSDMMFKHRILKQFRNFVLKMKHRQIQKFDVVVTDRLHGMVLAYLNGRKCVALSNYNYKVEGTYDFIKEDTNIVFLNEQTDLKIELILKMLRKSYNFDNYVDQSKFNIILNIIKDNRL